MFGILSFRPGWSIEVRGKQAVLDNRFRRIADRRKGMPERSAISSRECCPSERFNTQRRALISAPIAVAAGRAVEVSAAQLRFAVRDSGCNSVDCFRAHPRSRTQTRSDSGKLSRPDEVQIVRRSVVLREGSPDAPHQAADRKIEAGRAILALVIAVGRELENLGRFAA